MKKCFEKALVVIGGLLLFNAFLCGLCAADSFRGGRNYMKYILLVAAAAGLAGYATYLARTGGACDVLGFGALGCFVIMAILLAIWGWIAKWFWRKHSTLLAQITQEGNAETESDPEEEEYSVGARVGVIVLRGLAALGIVVFVGGLFMASFWLGSEGLLGCASFCLVFFIVLVVVAAIWPLIALLFWQVYIKTEGKFRSFGEFFAAATKDPIILAEKDS